MCLHRIESWVCWGLSVCLYSSSYTVKCGARVCICLHVSRAKHSSVCVCTFWELDVSAHTEGWECGCMRLNISKAGSASQGAVQLHQGCVHASGLCVNSCPVCMHLFNDGVLVWYCNKIGLQFPKGLMSLTACQENKDKFWQLYSYTSLIRKFIVLQKQERKDVSILSLEVCVYHFQACSLLFVHTADKSKSKPQIFLVVSSC